MAAYSRLSCVIWAVAVSIGFTEVFADGNNPMSHPKASEVVPVGEPYDIEWNPKTPGPVKITLHYGNNVPLQNITPSTQNDGSYSWTPEQSLTVTNDGLDYFMSICDLGTADCTYTFNGRFSFAEPNVSSSVASTSTRLQLPTASSSLTTTVTATSPTVSGVSATPSPIPSSGISTTAKVVTGVALWVVATTLLLVGSYVIRGRRRAREARAREALWEEKRP